MRAKGGVFMTVHAGVDVGGTFTDAIAIDEATGAVHVAKVPTTPENQAFGFLESIRSMAIDLPDINWLVHGTTVGTNAALEKKRAACGMITTEGFRDVVELGRRDRPQTYGLFGTFEPLIPRERRIEVAQRMDAFGEVYEPLDEAAIEAGIGRLLALGAESLLIGFLHSYANPAHERRAREIAERLWPNPYITTSADVLGEFREFERFTTASLNAYLQPLIHRYVSRLREELQKGGIRRDLAIMQANGGIASADLAWQRAVGTVLSGPAAGVVAASHISALAAFENVITCDMGGTSFDVGVIVGGEPVVSHDRELEYNMPVRLPIIDIHTIGAGGGSIASVNAAGILQVGPRSAGAVPGPIAYRRGGTEVTVTDANVLLGRLANENLLGVEGAVDLDELAASFESQLGEKLGLSGVEAAAAVLKIVNDNMAGAMRLVTLRRGHDPREFAVFGFGGAGPLHATALARELDAPKVLVPYLPGIACALGCIVADVRHDFVQTVGRPVDEVERDEVAAILAEQAAAGRELLAADGVAVRNVEVVHEGDL
jgi:N-methylhydantoinase A